MKSKRSSGLLVVSAAALVLGGLFIAVYSPGRREPKTERSSNLSEGFDLSQVEEPSPPPSRPVPPAIKSPMRTSQSVVMLPPPPRSRPAGPGGPTSLGNRREKWLADFFSRPAEVLTRQTLLGKPAAFSRFLRDKNRINRYLGHPLVSGVLDSPVLLRAVLNRPAVVRAFLSSPAMQDQRAVAVLARSSLVKELADRKAVRDVLQDPVLIRRMITDPQVLSWFAKNPEGMAALGRLAPALGRALPAVSGKSR